MTDILLQKTANGFLVPASDEEFLKVRKFRVGSVIRCHVSTMRNYEFHKKWFALIGLAFDVWSETAPQQEYKGVPVLADRDRFRRDITILAGFFRPVFNVKGELRLEAESISFANMSADRFEELYSKTIDVILQKILPDRGLTEQNLRELVEQVIRFS